MKIFVAKCVATRYCDYQQDVEYHICRLQSVKGLHPEVDCGRLPLRYISHHLQALNGASVKWDTFGRRPTQRVLQAHIIP